MSYANKIDKMVWSFSRLNSFNQCKHMFKLRYIDGIKGEGNFFSDYGMFIHDLLERNAKQQLEDYELPTIYEKEYNDTINYPAPPNKYISLAESYYNSGLDYVSNFTGFGNYEIVAVEKRVEFEINNIKLIGYIDLLVKDRDNNYHIIDHKSSDVKSINSERARDYWKQMMLYSIPIKNEYGMYPRQLHINAFRKQDWFTLDFDESKVDDIKQWIINTVNKIKKEKEWAPKSDSFFCNFLCNFRNICEYKPQRY